MPTYFLGQYETRQYSDDNGAPLAGGRIAAYLSGTSTPTPTYGNAVGTPNPHPLVLDSAGRGTIYLDTALTYKFLVTDAAGVTIATIDPINPLPLVTPGNIFTVGAGSAAFPGFTFTGDANTGLYSPGADILAVTTGGTERARWGPTGGMNIGGTTDPGDDNLRVEGTLTVQGASTLTGPLTVAGAATFSGGITGTLAAAGLTVTTLGVTGLATIANLTVQESETIGGNLTVLTGTTTLGGLLDVVGHAALGAGLTVTGATSLSGTLSASGLATLAALTVSGTTTLGVTTAESLTVGGNLHVLTGTTTLGGLLDVVGAVTCGAGLAITGTATVGGTLAVTGNVQVGGPNVTDAVATPAIQSGFNGGSIAGKAYAFRVTTGGAGATTGIIVFNQTFANPPVCTVSQSAGTGVLTVASGPSTMSIATTVGWPAGTVLTVICRGY